MSNKEFDKILDDFDIYWNKFVLDNPQWRLRPVIAKPKPNHPLTSIFK